MNRKDIKCLPTPKLVTEVLSAKRVSLHSHRAHWISTDAYAYNTFFKDGKICKWLKVLFILKYTYTPTGLDTKNLQVAMNLIGSPTKYEMDHATKVWPNLNKYSLKTNLQDYRIRRADKKSLSVIYDLRKVGMIEKVGKVWSLTDFGKTTLTCCIESLCRNLNGSYEDIMSTWNAYISDYDETIISNRDKFPKAKTLISVKSI